MRRSERAAAAVTPGEANRADAAGADHDHRPFDDDRPFDNNDAAAIDPASAFGPAMHAGAAAAGGIGGAKARDCRCRQNRREKVFHVFSLHFGAAPRDTVKDFKPYDSMSCAILETWSA
jgi:hypothetical protein